MKCLSKTLIVFIICLVYLFLSSKYSNLLFPDFKSIFLSLLNILSNKNSLIKILYTIFRITISFLITVFLSILFGYISFYSRSANYIFEIFNSIIKATPIASIILILMYFFNTGKIPIISSFFVTFPSLFLQIKNNISNLDPNLDNLCKVYHIEGLNKFFNYNFMSLLPNILDSICTTFSLIVKVTISSEIIVYVKKGIGTEITNASLMFDTSALFSWTIVSIIICKLFEKSFSLLVSHTTNNMKKNTN